MSNRTIIKIKIFDFLENFLAKNQNLKNKEISSIRLSTNLFNLKDEIGFSKSQHELIKKNFLFF
jgi:hypothetical protein